MFKLIKEPKLLFLIFLLALFLRTYQLSTFPFGFHADEVRVAWNALSILKTGKDDHQRILGLYYNTFGDYRPTGIFYLTVPSILAFGRNEFAVRFPSALFGALTVFPLYFFVLELTKKKGLSLLSSLLLTLSPWHIEVARATSEVAISAFFAIAGLYYFIRLIKENKIKSLLLSLLMLLLSYLFYHSIRFLGPFFVSAIIVYFWKEIRKNSEIKKRVLAVFGTILLVSMAFSATKEARMRLSQVSVFNDIDVGYELERVTNEEKSPLKTLQLALFHNHPFVYLRRFVNEYSNYLSSDFLLVSANARPYRYITPGVGLLTFIDFALFALGIIYIIRRQGNYLPLLLLLISPFPAAMTTEDSPNLHRAFFMILFIVIIESYGVLFLSQMKTLKRKIIPLVFVTFILNFSYFTHMYLSHSALHKPLYLNVNMDGSSYRNVGAKELALKLDSLSQKYDKIILTNWPDSLYPWYAFFTNKNPGEFNSFATTRKNGPWAYNNIVFSQEKCPSDDSFIENKSEKLLVIDSGVCAYESKIKDGLPIKVADRITRPDGSDVYVLLERK